jgi:hypothetical protein
MLRGYRHFVFALVGWLILSAANQPPQQQANSANANQVQPEPSYAPYGPLSEDPCYRSKSHDTADLCAQWRAAFAAEKTAHEARRATDWAIAASAISALALAGLFLSLRQTNKALELARESNYTELRAYLYPGIFKIKPVTGSKWRAHVMLINGGHTPAKDVMVYFKARQVPYPLQSEAIWEFQNDGVLYSALGPQSERQVNAPITLSVNDQASVMTRKSCILAQMAIAYTTYKNEKVVEPTSLVIVTGPDLEEGTMRIITPRYLEALRRDEEEDKRSKARSRPFRTAEGKLD